MGWGKNKNYRLWGIPSRLIYQAPLSMGISSQEYWSGLPFLLQGIFLPSPGAELSVSYISCIGRPVLYLQCQNMKTDSQDHNPEHQFLMLIGSSIHVRGSQEDITECTEVTQQIPKSDLLKCLVECPVHPVTVPLSCPTQDLYCCFLLKVL